MVRITPLRIGLAGLLAFAFVYAPALNHSFTWDDKTLASHPAFEGRVADIVTITQQELVDREMLSVVGFEVPFDSYRPVLNLSHYAEIQAFGREPLPMHAINLLLALLSAWLAFIVLRDVFCIDPTWAAAGAALFLLHPIQVESIAYISGRGDLLAGLFAFLSVALAGRSACEERRMLRWTFALVAGVALSASVLSKESSLGLLPWCLVAALLPGDPKSRRFQDWLPSLVSQALAVAGVFGLRGLVLSASSEMDGLSLLSQVFGLAGVMLEYLRVFFLPLDCSIERLARSGSYPWAWLVVLPLCILMLWLSFRRDSRFGTLHRQWALCLAWVGAALATAPIAMADTGVLSDRYAFSALLGLVAAAVAGLARVGVGNVLGRLFVATMVVWCIMVVWVASAQVHVWRDNETLYTHSVRMAPDSAMAYYRLGYLHASKRDWATAIPLLKQSLVKNPNLARGHNNLGVALMNVGAFPEAALRVRRAIELTGGQHYRAWNNLGLAELGQGHTTIACKHFAQASQVNPQYAEAIKNFSMYCGGQP